MKTEILQVEKASYIQKSQKVLPESKKTDPLIANLTLQFAQQSEGSWNHYYYTSINNACVKCLNASMVKQIAKRWGRGTVKRIAMQCYCSSA